MANSALFCLFLNGVDKQTLGTLLLSFAAMGIFIPGRIRQARELRRKQKKSQDVVRELAAERARQWAYVRYLNANPDSESLPIDFRVILHDGEGTGRGTVYFLDSRLKIGRRSKYLRRQRLFRVESLGPGGQEEFYIFPYDDVIFIPTFTSGPEAFHFRCIR